eukprot:2368736-Rhodomonas_salina.4
MDVIARYNIPTDLYDSTMRDADFPTWGLPVPGYPGTVLCRTSCSPVSYTHLTLPTICSV